MADDDQVTPLGVPQGKEKGKVDSQDLDDEQPSQGSDFLSVLRKEFTRPFLTLIQNYLGASENRKGAKASMGHFRMNHPYIYRICCFLDAGLKLIYLLIVLAVVARGLSIDDFLFEIRDRIYQPIECDQLECPVLNESIPTLLQADPALLPAGQ